jgi:hypothetical protein
MNEAIVPVLGTAIIALIAYIFVSFKRDTSDRLRHHDELMETMVKSNQQLSEIMRDHDYRLKTVERTLKIKLND